MDAWAERSDRSADLLTWRGPPQPLRGSSPRGGALTPPRLDGEAPGLGSGGLGLRAVGSQTVDAEAEDQGEEDADRSDEGGG